MQMTEILVVALTILGEAEGEPWAGKVMVAEVICNRARASGKTMRQVCLERKQFSCWNSGQRGMERRLCEIQTMLSPAWRDCLRLAKDVCQPGHKTCTPAMFYFNPKLASPKWAKAMKKIAVVGNHVFYVRKNHNHRKETAA